MKVLVVGGGGREHALIRKLKESPQVDALFCAPGNGGIAADARCVPIAAMDIKGMIDFARQNSIDFVVVAPDDPLAAGMVDEMRKAGFKTFGPDKKAAEIESSKVFSKNLMKRYGIPTAGYETFSDFDSAFIYIRKQNRYPVVIKADGLALGKGVVIAQSEEEARNGLQTIMQDKVFGASGNRVVIEEYLTGPEVTVLAFTDGKTVCPMVSSKDHKRAYDGDKGPNTGGMGTISPNPYYTDEMANLCMHAIFLPTVEAMKAEGRPFSGCLYFGLMLTPDGPKVIEYNARFGDPEAQVVLPRLETDLMEIMLAIDAQTLDSLPIKWSREACACVVMASGGYPGSYEKGLEITGLDADGQLENAVVYHAGTLLQEGKYRTNGGRVLGVTAKGKTVPDALKQAYAAVSRIHFDGAMYRQDIGK